MVLQGLAAAIRFFMFLEPLMSFGRLIGCKQNIGGSLNEKGVSGNYGSGFTIYGRV